MAPPPTGLVILGPPEINKPTPPSQPEPAFGDSMNGSNRARPPMALTENGSATFLTSSNPCLDLFFHVLPEVYMGANQWGAIPYNRVASVAMKLYKISNISCRPEDVSRKRSGIYSDEVDCSVCDGEV
ncbi:hypothetical protein GBA52_017822 [Prunus armeniaca]|nr:hypothetical protein GBA52_017822 [Prunus armeniaca]